MKQRPNSHAASSSASPAAPQCSARFRVVTVRPAEATPAMLASAIRNVVGEAAVRTGKVKLDIPPLVENGNTVPMTVSVESPMTRGGSRQEHPRFQREEPATKHRQFPSRPACRPRAGLDPHPSRRQPEDRRHRKAVGRSFWSASVDVVVTLAACTEDVI